VGGGKKLKGKKEGTEIGKNRITDLYSLEIEKVKVFCEVVGGRIRRESNKVEKRKNYRKSRHPQKKGRKSRRTTRAASTAGGGDMAKERKVNHFWNGPASWAGVK